MKKWLRPMIALVLAVSVTGCYGPFNLTRKLHAWNGTVGGKWVNEGVFLAMAIFPVYTFAALGDAVVFNSIEFWTGKNPITAKATRSINKGSESAVLSYAPQSRRLRVDSFDKGRASSTVILEPGLDGSMVAHGQHGEVLMSAATENGMVVVKDASGRVIARHDPAEAQKLMAD